MKYVKEVNNLVVKFIRLDYQDELQAEMLVMERPRSLDFRLHEFEVKELLTEVFEKELVELHRAGFVHRDLRRSSGIGGVYSDNILLAEKGLRLIDVGISAFRKQVGDKIFEKYL